MILPQYNHVQDLVDAGGNVLQEARQCMVDILSDMDIAAMRAMVSMRVAFLQGKAMATAADLQLAARFLGKDGGIKLTTSN